MFKIMQRKIIFLVSMIALASAVTFLFIVTQTVAKINEHSRTKQKSKYLDKRILKTKAEKPLKNFAYLTQTESCLYDYLRSPQQLGSSTNCQCDVLVLSYKESCNDSSLPHVEYIFAPNTTWTTGRNLLYESIRNREQKYLYYTFLDDDIRLWTKVKSNRSLTPWREYENSLLQVRPLIAVSWDHDLKHFSKYYNNKCDYPEKTDFLPFVWYDAMFNSFHGDIVDYLLPYYSKMESTSIWYSQLYLIIKTDLMFPGQVFHHTNVIASNPLHRPYARKGYTSNTVRAFLDDLRNEIPAEYWQRLEPQLQDWVKNMKQKEAVTYHCPPFPTVMKPPVPYGHLQRSS